MLVILIAGVLWFAIQARRLQQELGNSERERSRQEQRQRDLEREIAGERTRADQLASDLAQIQSEERAASPTPTPANATSPILATLILNVSSIRGAESGPAGTIRIPKAPENARIQLNLQKNDYSHYTVVIQRANGTQLVNREGLRSRSSGTRARLFVIVPTRMLVAGDYILTLQGVASSGEIHDVSKLLFRVE